MNCSKIPCGHAIATAVLSAALVWLVIPSGAAQNYPLPKPKPPVPARAEPHYPLPKPNPRRRARREAPALSVAKPGRPSGSRAADAEETGAPETAAKAWTAAEIDAARTACRKMLAGVAVTYTDAAPIGGPGRCGIAAPIRVTAIGAETPVTVSPPAVVNCALAAAAVRWMDTKVQPLAREEFGEPVVQVRNAASYVCRRRNNRKNGRLSEHALGNALDLSSFTLKSGRTVTVLKGWRGQKDDSLVEEVVTKLVERSTPESRFLKQAHAGACSVFSTILGPDADKYHVDHFHLDLGRGGRYLVCR